ncbi:MAG TPA: aminoglycoside phosphotransferase family protein [Magnetospirillaceae bacterium]|jgi:aminoglycoside phosphotransferase (APT) family kinase protein
MSDSAADSDDPATITAALRRMGLLATSVPPTLTPLTGGVSSDILLVEGVAEPFCIKRALAKLKVAADWRAPVARNHAEAEWLRVAGAIIPAAAPKVLGEDEALGLFAMPYLTPDKHPVWKALLRDGKARHEVADQVGAALVRIHAATADDRTIAARFANDETFYAIRLEPYLVATGRAHPDLAPTFEALVARTAQTKRVLVHGDVSPKNILVGPEGPVFLDAECAWYGDPAFDAAFCLNHLLLKCVWRPGNAARFLDMFDRLTSSYLAGATWEPRSQLESRIASLLPALLLARIDGKSPVEYITEDTDRERVRRFAIPFIRSAPTSLAAIRAAWAREMRA